MRFDLLTIFPEIFRSYLEESIIKRAIEKKLIEIHVHNIRDYSKDKHQKVDDIPYGGGPGMVMMPQPIYDCILEVKKENNGPVIYFTPRGKTLTQSRAEKIFSTHETKSNGFILLCGRYEGVDQRVIDLVVNEEISIGNYVLTGGELPAMIFLDVISRFIPGVLGDHESKDEESFSKALNRKKEYPHYTRPETFLDQKVPDILLSGHHANIKKWRHSNTK
jgi:tRNA (guanine37-N1)-methyltransferase